MPNSPRMHWPYPSRDQDPWFDAFEDFLVANDASAYACREDRNTLMGGGGFVSFTVSDGVLAWSSALEVYSTIAGFRFNIAPGSVVLQDGQLFYVELVRYPTNNITLVPVVADRVPTSDNAYVIGIRRGATVYFRFGASIGDGDSINIFEGGGGGSGTDTYEREATFSIPDGSSATTTATIGRVTYAGSLIGLSLEITEAVVAGTVTVNIRRNGVVTLSTVLNTSFPTSRQITVSSGTHAVVQNDAITVEVVAAGYDNASGNNGGLTVVTTLLAGVSAAPPDIPDASNVQKGITRLSALPVLSNDPIAVGDNDPRVDTWTRSGTNVNLIHSGDVVHAGAIELDTAGTANYLQAEAGSTAAVSAANTGRIRYNESLQRWEISSNGAAYVAIASGSTGVTLDGAYDFGGAGAGRTITADANAVRILSSAADNNNLLEIEKTPAGAQSGHGVQVVMNSNATGYGVRIVRDSIGVSGAAVGLRLVNTTAAGAGSQQQSPDLVFGGQGWKTDATAGSQQVDWRLYALPVQGAANPGLQLVLAHQINLGGWVNHTVFTNSSTAGTTAQILASDGAVGTPAYSFAGLTTTGMYRSGNDLRFRATTNISLYIGTTNVFDAGSTYFRSATNNSRDLGQTSFRWRDGWFARQINLDSTEADNNNVLIVSKVPAGAQSGNGVNVTMGPNATGWGGRVLHTNLSTSTAYTAGGYNVRYGDIQERGILLENSTLSVDGARLQNSPAIFFKAHAFDTIADVDREMVAGINLTAIVDNTAGSLDVPYPRLDFWIKEGGAGGALERVFSIAGNPFFAGIHMPLGNDLIWYDASDPGYATSMARIQADGTYITATRAFRAPGVLPSANSTYDLGDSFTPLRWQTLYNEYIDTLQPGSASVAPPKLVLAVGGSHTSMTLAEHTDVLFNLAQVKQWDGSSTSTPWSVPTQRAYRIQAPTYSAANNNGIIDPEGGGTAGGIEFTQIATLAISGAPSISTNAACPSLARYAFWVESGISQFDGMIKTNNQSTVGGDIRLRPRTANPTTLADGDFWYRQDTNALHYRSGGTTYTLSTGAGGGVTLDGAYDFGGAGAGRSITADSGAVTITSSAANSNNILELTKSPAGAQTGAAITLTLNSNTTGSALIATVDGTGPIFNTQINNIGADPSIKGLWLRNTTAAGAGAQQASPDIFFAGNGWKTDATAGSQPVDARIFLLPVQGTANPSAHLVFHTRINNGTSVRQLAITSGGQLLAADGTNAAPTYSFANATGMGWYANTSTDMGAAVSGTVRMQINASRLFLNFSGSAGAPAIQINDTNSGITGGADSVGISIAASHYLLCSAAGGIVASKQMYTTPVALTWGANVAVNALNSNVFTLTLTGSTAQLDNPSNLVAGMTYAFVITQDGTGGRALTFDTNYKFGNAGAPAIGSMIANEVMVISMLAVSASKLICTSIIGGF